MISILSQFIPFISSARNMYIREDQIGKVCYLIDQTKRKLQAEIQEEWKDKIIEALKIKPLTYKSKYKGTVRILPANRIKNSQSL